MNTQIRITKEFTFDMAHALHGYSGKCAHIHGHTYHMEVTVIGKPIADEDNPNLGMVMDFSVLKKIVHNEVLAVFDHAVVLKDTHPLVREIEATSSNLIKTTYQPTCENLLIDFASRISRYIHPPLKLHTIRLRETATSYATWHAADN